MSILGRILGRQKSATPPDGDAPIRDRVRQLQQEVLDWVVEHSDDPSLAAYFARVNDPDVRARAEALGIERWDAVVASDMRFNPEVDETPLRVGHSDGATPREFAVRANDIPTEVQDYLSMEGVTFYMPTRFQPYDSCRLAAHATHTQPVTYDGMGQSSAPLVLDGNYQQINLQGINNIDVVVADNSQIGTLNLNSLKVSLTICDGVNINRLNARNAHLTVVHTGDRSTVQHADFIGTPESLARISARSEMRGTWNNITADHAGFVDVNARGITINGATITNSELRGWDLTGATVANLTIDGERILTEAQLHRRGIVAANVNFRNMPGMQRAADPATNVNLRTPPPTTNRTADLAKTVGFEFGKSLETARQSIGTPTMGAAKTRAPEPSKTTVPPALANPGVRPDPGAGLANPTIGSVDPRNIWAQKEAPPQPAIPRGNERLATIAQSMQTSARAKEVPEYLLEKQRKNDEFLARMRLQQKKP